MNLSNRTAFALACGVAWAIAPQWLTTILEIAKREGPGPEAVEVQLGRPLANAQKVTTRDGVAVVPIVGPIFRHANAFSAVSGATSVEILARDLRVALDDPSIKAIVLNVDSPGGEITGVHELAEMVYSARGRKPIVAYVGGSGASAAYWIASAADEVVASATAIVGSIGVVQVTPRPTADAPIEIVSSNAPNKKPDVTTDKGRAVVQKNVDAIADVFIDDVARFRGVTRAKVLSDFGQGATFVGKGARVAGLVDAIGSLEGVIARLQGRTVATPAQPIVPIKQPTNDPRVAQAAATAVGFGAALDEIEAAIATTTDADGAITALAELGAKSVTTTTNARTPRTANERSTMNMTTKKTRDELLEAARAKGHGAMTPEEGRIARLTGLSPSTFVAARNDIPPSAA